MTSVYDTVLLFALYSFSCALLNLLSLSLFSLYVSLFLSFSLSLALSLLVRTTGMNRVLRINEILLLVFGYVKNYFFHMRKCVDYTYQIFRNILDKDAKEKERKPN